MLTFLKKTLLFHFSNLNGGKLLLVLVAFILSNQGYGQDFISIDDVAVSEGDAGTTNFDFTVSVDGGGNAAANIGFTVNTADGTATL
ncbi:hypothetical protein, partial [Flagellimonas algicola]